ncbi:MAG: hypothetical protein DRR42_27005, partial [Gammaproteobacteria bacterium]
HLIKSGASPHVYVHGANDSADVRIAQTIATGEGFSIQHSANEAAPDFSLDELPERLEDAYFYLDGIPFSGLFDDWAMISKERRAKHRPELLRLYGMGGEVFRLTRHLADRPHTLSEYLKTQYDNFEHSAYTDLFDKGHYLNSAGAKLVKELGIKNELMSRSEIELAYPLFSMPRISGPQMSLQNERAYALVPYSEPVFTHLGGKIPIEDKYLGRFQAALINRASPSLAGYMSEYGYSFADGPGFKAKVLGLAKQMVPQKLRPFLRRQKAKLKSQKKSPFYLTDDFVRKIFPDGCPNIEPFLQVQNQKDYRLLSKALSLEIILSGKYCE